MNIRHSSKPSQPLTSHQQGAAVLIMMLILVLGSTSFLLSKINEGKTTIYSASHTSQELKKIRAALIGHAQLNGGCLPCPSQSASNGTAPANCTTATRAGFLPWQTLSLGAEDHWNHRYRYLVDPAFAVGCDFLSSPDMESLTRNSLGALIQHTDNLVAVVISHGPNGAGAFDATGNSIPNPPASHTDERSNGSATDSVVKRPMDLEPTAYGGPFDDIVIWIDRQELRDQVNNALGNLPP